MGGEDSQDPDKQIAEGYWYPEQGGEKEKAEGSKLGLFLSALFTVATIKERVLIAPLVIALEWLGVPELFEKTKDKRSATAKKLSDE
jgi:hypothetical protein